VFSGKLDIYDNGVRISATNYRLDASSVIWTVGTMMRISLFPGARGRTPFAIEAGAPGSAL
jgi:hypothetical protein